MLGRICLKSIWFGLKGSTSIWEV